MGDLDVYGYLILEDLKAKTKIPFQAEQMDLTTLKHFYDAGLCKPLTVSYRRIIKQNKKSLRAYSGVLDLMLKYNCKEEQESLQVLEILLRRIRVWNSPICSNCLELDFGIRNVLGKG